MESWRRHIEEPRGHHANYGTLNNFGPSPSNLCLHIEQNSQPLSVNNRMYKKHVCRWSVTHFWSYWIRVQHLQQLLDGVVSSWTGNWAESNCLTGTTHLKKKNQLCNTNDGGNAIVTVIRRQVYPAGVFFLGLTAQQAPVWWKWPGTAPL